MSTEEQGLDVILVGGERHGERTRVPDFRPRHVPDRYGLVEVWGAKTDRLTYETGDDSGLRYRMFVCFSVNVARDYDDHDRALLLLACAKAAGVLTTVHSSR
jgi:hypothetical protein